MSNIHRHQQCKDDWFTKVANMPETDMQNSWFSLRPIDKLQDFVFETNWWKLHFFYLYNFTLSPFDKIRLFRIQFTKFPIISRREIRDFFSSISVIYDLFKERYMKFANLFSWSVDLCYRFLRIVKKCFKTVFREVFFLCNFHLKNTDPT